MYIFIYIYDFFGILKSRLFKYFIVIYYYYLRKEMVLVRAKTYINTMTIDIIRNKNKNIIHFLLSAMIFVLISKSYFYFIYVVNLKSNISLYILGNVLKDLLCSPASRAINFTSYPSAFKLSTILFP